MTHPPGSQKDQKKAIRRDESDDDEMRQGKRPKVVAKKKTAGSNAGKNPPEERTLDSSPNYPAFQSSSEGARRPQANQPLSGSVDQLQVDIQNHLLLGLGLHPSQTNSADAMFLLMSMQGSSVAGHLPVTTHGDQGALARVIESLAATQQRSGGLPVNTLADHRTNEVIGSLLRYRALLQPALTNTAETAQQLPPTMQTTYPTTMSENASLIQFWIQQQAAAQVSPQPNQLLGLLSGTLNNPALVRAAALSHPHRLPSFVLGNQRDANGIASIHQAREARQPSGMLSTARPSPGGLGIDSKAFSSIGPDGHPIDLPAILSLPEDHIKLSTHQVFLRHQIEAFRASVEDISTHTRGRNKPVTTGQIGIRCRHCAHIPVGQRQKGSTYFPATLLGLYQAAQNMSTTHMQCGLCLEMPNEIKQQFAHLISTKVASFGAGRPYWEKAAKKLGFVDTDNGIRFVRDQNISEQQRQNASSTEEQKT